MMLAMEKRREDFELKLEELNRQERKRTNRIMIWLTIALILFCRPSGVCSTSLN